jgi:hypothetical protein
MVFSQKSETLNWQCSGSSLSALGRELLSWQEFHSLGEYHTPSIIKDSSTVTLSIKCFTHDILPTEW